MTAYLVAYGANPADRFVARAYDKRAEAWKASTDHRFVPGVPAGSHCGGCAYVIEWAPDVTFSGRLLMQVYKELTGINYSPNMDRQQRVRLLMEALKAQSVRDQSMEANIEVEQPTAADTVPLSEPTKKRSRKTTKGEGTTPRTYTRKDAAADNARQGVMPEKPVVTSETNKHRQKHFDALETAALAGEWDTVRDYQMKGTDTYCKMIHRYRDNLLAYHAASASADTVRETELEAA